MPLVDLDGPGRSAPPLPVLWESAITGRRVGLEEAGTVTAWAVLARAREGTVAVQALAASSEGNARTLLDGLAGATGDAALAAPSDAEGGLLARLGFTSSGSDSWLRTPPAPVVPPDGATHVVDPVAAGLDDLARTLRGAWSRATSADPREWSPESPARGQCDVTAAIVQEIAGGVVLVADAVRDGRRMERHAWNRLPDGRAVDLTREQFAPGTWLTEPTEGLTRMPGFEERLAALRAALAAVTEGR